MVYTGAAELSEKSGEGFEEQGRDVSVSMWNKESAE